MTTTPSTTGSTPAASAGTAERIDLANGYVLMLAETHNKWRIVDPEGHDQGHIVSEPDRILAFAEAMTDTVEISKIAARTTEKLLGRERTHKLVLEMLQHREHQNDIGVRCGIALAASTIKRGRHLTEDEKLRNLCAGLANDDEQGRTADDWFAALTGPKAQVALAAEREARDAGRDGEKL